MRPVDYRRPYPEYTTRVRQNGWRLLIKGLKSTASIIWLVAIISFLIVIIVNVFLLVWGVSIVAPGTLTGVPATTTLVISFDNPMNQTSVQHAFSISPSVNGTFHWHGNTMIFNPSTSLAYKTTYSVKIDGGIAMDLERNTLDGNKNGIVEYSPLDDHKWFFTTETLSTRMLPPQVILNTPVGTTVNASTPITMTFSAPMNRVSVQEGFTYSDGETTWTKANGSFYWYKDTVVFTPHHNFTQGTTYTVTLDSGTIRDLNGKPLDGNKDGTIDGPPSDDYTWFFTTTLSTGTTPTQVPPQVMLYGPIAPQPPRDPLFIITPQPMILVFIDGFWLLAWYIFIISALLASFLFMVLGERKTMLRDFFKGVSRLEAQTKSRNALIIVAQLFCIVIFFDLVYSLLLYLFNVDVYTPPSIVGGSLWQLMYLLAKASVYEEIIARLLLIGVPLFFVDLFCGERKKSSRYLLGGGFDMNLPAVVFLFFSSGMFAFAHVFSWDYYKVVPTFIAGLAFGYLFLKKGIYASIILHFAFNYLSISTFIWESYVLDATLVLLIIGWSVVGFGLFIHYILGIIGFYRKKKVREKKKVSRLEEPLPPPPPPPPTPPRYYPLPPKPPISPRERHGIQPMFGYQCPRCGSTEARYSQEGFECLKCGFKTHF